MIKLQDFARRHGVTDRAIQKHLKTYAAELEGKFERKGPNGTWLSDEACEILLSKMKQPPAPVIYTEDPRVKELERELFETQQKFTDYVANVTPLLETASKQLALAERSEEYKQRAEALEAQNADLSAEKEKQDELLKELGKEAQAANRALETLVNGSWRERRKLRRELKQKKTV